MVRLVALANSPERHGTDSLSAGVSLSASDSGVRLPLAVIEALTDQLPRAPFFAKDASLRYMSANLAMCELCGVSGRDEIIGETARSFFQETARRRHENADRYVMRTLTPTRDQLDYCLRARGDPIWLLLTRAPIVNERGQATGVAAIGRVLDGPDRRHPAYKRVAAVVEHIKAHFGAPIDIAALAADSGTSVRQLKRDFLKLFGLPPQRYITKVRFEAALELLKSDQPIVDVAQACGYGDQSAFSRRFKAAVGMSPSAFRRTMSPRPQI
jgi:PAS domain S-box-containing protein